MSEYEETLAGLQEEVEQRTHRISQLEASVQDLNTLRKEKDMKEEELSLKSKEVVYCLLFVVCYSVCCLLSSLP